MLCVCVFASTNTFESLFLLNARRASPVRFISFQLAAHSTRATCTQWNLLIFLFTRRSQQEQVFVPIQMCAMEFWIAANARMDNNFLLFAMRTHKVQCINEYQWKEKRKKNYFFFRRCHWILMPILVHGPRNKFYGNFILQFVRPFPRVITCCCYVWRREPRRWWIPSSLSSVDHIKANFRNDEFDTVSEGPLKSKQNSSNK